MTSICPERLPSSPSMPEKPTALASFAHYEKGGKVTTQLSEGKQFFVSALAVTGIALMAIGFTIIAVPWQPFSPNSSRIVLRVFLGGGLGGMCVGGAMWVSAMIVYELSLEKILENKHQAGTLEERTLTQACKRFGFPVAPLSPGYRDRIIKDALEDFPYVAGLLTRDRVKLDDDLQRSFDLYRQACDCLRNKLNHNLSLKSIDDKKTVFSEYIQTLAKALQAFPLPTPALEHELLMQFLNLVQKDCDFIIGTIYPEQDPEKAREAAYNALNNKINELQNKTPDSRNPSRAPLSLETIANELIALIRNEKPIANEPIAPIANELIKEM